MAVFSYIRTMITTQIIQIIILVVLFIYIHIQFKTIKMNQAELAAELVAIKEQNEKARLEILAKITALEEALANAGNTTPEVDSALADLKASVQTDDDLNPDVV